MVGADVSNFDTRGNVIQGDAGVTVDFGRRDVDVAFTNVVDLDTGRRHLDMTWTDISMYGGTFETGSGNNQIEGRFYGPNHEEVGGVFERNRIIGAFGATRD